MNLRYHTDMVVVSASASGFKCLCRGNEGRKGGGGLTGRPNGQHMSNDSIRSVHTGNVAQRSPRAMTLTPLSDAMHLNPQLGRRRDLSAGPRRSQTPHQRARTSSSRTRPPTRPRRAASPGSIRRSARAQRACPWSRSENQPVSGSRRARAPERSCSAQTVRAACGRVASSPTPTLCNALAAAPCFSSVTTSSG